MRFEAQGSTGNKEQELLLWFLSISIGSCTRADKLVSAEAALEQARTLKKCDKFEYHSVDLESQPFNDV